MRSDYPMMENSMVLPTVTPAEYDSEGEEREPEFCAHCKHEIEEDYGYRDKVENEAGIFCSQSCASRELYVRSDERSRAALRRFVAALTLLAEEDVERMAPLLGSDHFDMEQVYAKEQEVKFKEISELRRHAVAFLQALDPEGSVPWALEAEDRALEFAQSLAKDVTA